MGKLSPKAGHTAGQGQNQDLDQACVTLKVPSIWPARWAQQVMCPSSGGTQERRMLAFGLICQVAVPRIACPWGFGYIG